MSEYVILEGIPELTTEDVNKKYDITTDFVGSGGFGYVVQGVKVDNPNEIYAVKVLETNTRKDRLLDEVFIMKKLNHPNLIFFIEAFQSVGYLYIVMELQMGDLKMGIENTRGFSEMLTCYVTNQIMRGILYIHRSQIVHRDLNPRNVFVTDRGMCKIGDFGEACEVGLLGAIGFHGTRPYMAPEVMKQERHGIGTNSYYGMACDIWSLGIIVMECIEGLTMFHGLNECDIRETVMSPDFQPYQLNRHVYRVSDELFNFIAMCLKVQPENRWTSEELFMHQWLVNNRQRLRESSKHFSNIVMRVAVGVDALNDSGYPESCGSGPSSSIDYFQRRSTSGERPIFRLFDQARSASMISLRSISVNSSNSSGSIHIFPHITRGPTPHLPGHEINDDNFGCFSRILKRLRVFFRSCFGIN